MWTAYSECEPILRVWTAYSLTCGGEKGHSPDQRKQKAVIRLSLETRPHLSLRPAIHCHTLTVIIFGGDPPLSWDSPSHKFETHNSLSHFNCYSLRRRSASLLRLDQTKVNDSQLIVNRFNCYYLRRWSASLSLPLSSDSLAHKFETPNYWTNTLTVMLFGGDPPLSWDSLSHEVKDPQLIAKRSKSRIRLSLYTRSHISLVSHLMQLTNT